MFSFLSLIHNSVTNQFFFLLLKISAIISSKTINHLHFLFGLHSLMFLQISSILFEYIKKALESLKYFLFALFRLLIKNLYFASQGSLPYKKVYQYLVHDLLD